MVETHSGGAGSGMSVWQWLFNPFRRIAGASALGIGLAMIIVSALACWGGRTHFDGVLDIHPGPSAPWWLFVGEGLSNWLLLSVMLMLAGLIVRGRTFRVIDVFGTEALARWPLVFTAGLPFILPVNATLDRLTAEFVASTQNHTVVAIAVTDVLVILAMAVVILPSAVWTVVLMYRAYAVSCDIKGKRAIFSFIVALIVAEVVSKFIVWGLFLAAGISAAGEM